MDNNMRNRYRKENILLEKWVKCITIDGNPDGISDRGIRTSDTCSFPMKGWEISIRLRTALAFGSRSFHGRDGRFNSRARTTHPITPFFLLFLSP